MEGNRSREIVPLKGQCHEIVLQNQKSKISYQCAFKLELKASDMTFIQAVEQVNIAVSPRADLQIGLGKPISSFFGRNRTATKFPSFFGLKALLFFLWQKPESP